MKKWKNTNWVYENDDNNNYRYILGEIFDDSNPLICIGVNPSCAVPNCLDQTLKVVRGVANKEIGQNWIMLNIYPERSTYIKDLNINFNQEYHNRNLNHFYQVFEKYPKSKIWAAWGTLIMTRPFLINCLIDIIEKK